MSNFDFYENKKDPNLRFGDVIKDFETVVPTFIKPLSRDNNEYSIKITKSQLYAIMTPCCSIEDKKIVVSPLIKVRSSFFDNSFFAEDLTRINIPITKRDGVSDTKKSAIEDGGALGYESFPFFVYDKNDYFVPYEIKYKKVTNERETKKINYYMVDFRDMRFISCDQFYRDNNNFSLEAKCLQLTIDTRNKLRLKLLNYYSRKAAEDEI